MERELHNKTISSEVLRKSASISSLLSASTTTKAWEILLLTRVPILLGGETFSSHVV